MTERIQNILSHAGVASRRHAAAMIEAGRVAVDGRVVTAGRPSPISCAARCRSGSCPWGGSTRRARGCS